MKITRGLSGLIATFVTITAVHSNFTYAEHKEDDFELIHSNQKITTELEEIMSSDVQNAFPVVVWTNSVSESELEDRIEVEIGFGIDSLEEEYSRPSNELIEELKRNAAGDYNKYLELLMAEYLDITDSARELEFKKTEKYKETKRAIYEEINTTCIYHVYEETGISNEKIRFVSRYAPMSVCCLTFEEINRLAQNNIVEEISLYEPIEAEVCTADFGTTKSTMGINKINNLLSLTGNGVNIGIYETDTVSQTYYAINGINASQVTIVGSTCGIGDHSTYCAGIAAGSAGIAPGANIYSASSHSDGSVFSWTNYDEVQMSDLEALISDGADIINMSWRWEGQGDVYNNYAKYIDYLIADTNTTIVCASGNDATQYIGAPGTAYNAITVNGFLDQYNNTTENILNNYGYNRGNGCCKPDVVAPSLHNGTWNCQEMCSHRIPKI